MYRACLYALAVYGLLTTSALCAATYEALPPAVTSDLARCDAETHLRSTPSRMGRFYGAVFDDADAPKSLYSRGIAVVIGVSEYDYQQTRLKSLPGVKADVGAMADFLISDTGGGQGYDAVIVLRDTQVTQSNVFCVVRAIGKMSRPDEVNPDRLMFYWSGHGVDVVEGGGRVGYLPYYGVSRDDVNETTALDMRKISTWAAGYFAGFRQAVFLIDSCVSGYATLTKGGASERGAVSITVPDRSVGYDRLMRDLKGLSEQYRMVITAANQEDPAYENVSGGDFTQSFLRLMREGSPEMVWRGDIFQTSLVDQMEEFQHRRQQSQGLATGPQVDAIPEPQLELFLGRRQSSFLVPASPQLLDLFEDALKARDSAAAKASTGAPARSTVESMGSSSSEAGRSSFVDLCSGGTKQRIGTLSDEELIRRDAVCEVTILSNPGDPVLRMSRAEILLERARRVPPEQAAPRYAAAEKELDAAGPQGWARIAGLIYDGDGYARSDSNDQRMLDLARRAYEQGDRKQAANVLGLAHLNGRGVARQPDRGIAYLQEASAAGYANAAQNLGVEYRAQGRYTEALSAFERAAEAGSVDAYMYAANLYFDGLLPGEQVERDAQSRRLVEQALAADGENAWALNYYGWLYRSGRGIEHDDAKAAAYFERSQKLGYLQAAINLGTMRRTGEGVEKDFALAASLFAGACQRNYLSGCTELADMKFDGDGFERTPEMMADAASLVDKALAFNSEDRFANELKAYALRNGFGAPADPALAETYYRKAGDLGSLWAWYQLGNMLRDQAAGLKDAPQRQMYARALDAFEQGISRNDSWSMVGKAALIVDKLVQTGQDPRVEVPALLRKPDAEKIVEAFDLLIRLYTTDAFGEPDRQAALPIIRRLTETETPQAKRWLAYLVTNGSIFLPAGHDLTILPPWEYYEACGALGWASCYGEAGDNLLATPAHANALTQGEAAGLYVALRGDQASERARAYYQKGAEGGDPRSRLAIATLKLADGAPPAKAEAKSMLSELQKEGHDFGTIGLVVAGIEEDRQSVDFQAGFTAIRGMNIACIQNEPVFAGSQTPYWPGFGCGRGDLRWPNWTLGLSQTKSRLNLRSKPGGPVIGELAAQTPLIFLRYGQDYAKGWLKVQTPTDQIGWVKASHLTAWQDKSAQQ